MRMRKVVVVGMGRIGLPTAASLAGAGFRVVGVDTDRGRLQAITRGEIGRGEPGLTELVSKVLSSGALRLSSETEPADAFILCLPTSLDDDLKCDLTPIGLALDSVSPVIRPGNLLVLESTVPVHTTRDFVLTRLRSRGIDVDSLLVAYAPERIISGRMLEEIRSDDRIIGGIGKEAAQAAKELYSSFVSGQIFLTDASTAELVKLIENIYRDVNIALANEIALFCDREGLDAWEAISLANRHPRVEIHRPGPGVGGHCIPVVPYFLAQTSRYDAMIRAARSVNDAMPRYVANMVVRAVGGTENPVVALMGVAYKPNSADPVNSPTLQVLDHLSGEDLRVVLCDPLVQESDLGLVDLATALASDCIVFLVAHDAFREIKPGKPRRGRGWVIDVANSIDPDSWRAQGWSVRAFAKPPSRA